MPRSNLPIFAFLLLLLSSSLVIATEDVQQQKSETPTCPENVREVLQWGVANKLIEETSLSPLLERCQQLAKDRPELFYLASPNASPEDANLTLSEPGLWSRAYSAVSSKFTLLNVLYTGGALLVIGAMTLFMTLGWEIFGGGGIFGIATLYGALFAVLGRYFYEGPKGGEWEVVSTILLTMTLFMTPLAVYGFQRMLGLWPIRAYSSSFGDTMRIPMTLGVMAVSAGILLCTKWSFFVAPIAAGAWLFSVDLVGNRPYTYTPDWHPPESDASLLLGSLMTVTAIVLDKVLGFGGVYGGTDYTFWLYGFGIAAFWIGLSTRKSNSEANGVLYLCINVFLVVLGQYLDRLFLMLFGGVGILAYSYVTLFEFKISNSKLIILRFLLTLLLLTSAYKYGSQIAFWASLAGLITWNTTNAMRINDPELYYLLQFIINFSLNQGCWTLFGERLVYFYLFDVRCSVMLYLVTLYGMLCLHPSLSTSSDKHRVYRLLLSYLMMAASFVYPVLGLAGSFGISGFIIIYEIDRPYWVSAPLRMIYYAFGLSLIIMSYVADSRVIYVQGLFITIFYLFGRDIYHNHFIGWKNCLFSVIVILLSVVFESQVLLLAGGIGVFLYLSYLAKKVFRNSILFPFALTVMGLGIIFIGVQYQKHQHALRGLLLALLPSTSTTFLTNASITGGKVAHLLKPYVEILPEWLGKLSAMDIYVIPAGIGIIFVLILLSKVYVRLFRTLKSTVPVFRVNEAYVYWPKDTEDHGLVFWLHGSKPSDFALSQAELHLIGDSMWQTLERQFGSAAVSAIKFTFYPLKLCNSYLDASKVKAGEDTFDIELHLGTGKLGGKRISHKTLKETLQQIVNNYDPTFDLQIQYTRRLGTVRGILFNITNLRCSDLLNAQHSTNGKRLKCDKYD